LLGLNKNFDARLQSVMPAEWYPEIRADTGDALSEGQRTQLGNEIIRWLLSGILAGERAAAALCRQIERKVFDPTAKVYAANQAREEDRHDLAFTNYLATRWGTPYPVGRAFGRFLEYLLTTRKLSHKVVGMSILVEGFAMGALSNIRAHTSDPALAKMLTLVLRDESVHHNFGALWIMEQRAQGGAEAWEDLQHFAIRGFDVLRINLLSIRQRRQVYRCVGRDWREVRAAVRRLRRDAGHSPGLEEDINPLSVVALNLDRAGLIPDSERGRLHHWLA
jgi:hypothetical protein